jgi:tRNA(fMet)-specific endonuclease VapC
MKTHVLLDTNICIYYMKGRYELDKVINSKNISSCCISEITVAELLYGATCSNRREEVLKEVEAFISKVVVLPIYDSLLTFAEIKSDLRFKGTLIDDFDLLIGATAIYNNLTLITENVKHLERIPHIKVDNWVQR